MLRHRARSPEFDGQVHEHPQGSITFPAAPPHPGGRHQRTIEGLDRPSWQHRRTVSVCNRFGWPRRSPSRTTLAEAGAVSPVRASRWFLNFRSRPTGAPSGLEMTSTYIAGGALPMPRRLWKAGLTGMEASGSRRGASRPSGAASPPFKCRFAALGAVLRPHRTDASRLPTSLAKVASAHPGLSRFSPFMTRAQKIGVILGLSLVAALTWLRASDPSALRLAREATFDEYQRLSPRALRGDAGARRRHRRAVAREFGQWPWPRDRVAQLIDAVADAGAAAIAFDIHFRRARPPVAAQRGGQRARHRTEGGSDAARQRRHPGALDRRAAGGARLRPFQQWPPPAAGQGRHCLYRRKPDRRAAAADLDDAAAAGAGSCGGRSRPHQPQSGPLARPWCGPCRCSSATASSSIPISPSRRCAWRRALPPTWSPAPRTRRASSRR